ncbi:RNA-directed DNA polymerase (Reverse transcriptase) [Trifolium medium]|uniref:RNA-directed DNA polymerase (Reverse transcriptase) n=1 Tax=Trifolium medium TaxID=97028 RepID=A0A392M2V4_9FABA|nr:RNA-directed DNA polymerase (Reverse transcriptase) [Trifolium medium]
MSNNWSIGVPITGKAPKLRDYQYLIDQVSSKLTSWKAKHLSFAGRITLAKAVFESIPVYPMMNASIPKSCLNDIQKIQRGFIWGDEIDKHKFHAVRWEIVTTPKEFGGLGLRDMHTMNVACLMKFGWDLRSGTDALWCRVLRGKYEWGTESIDEHQYWSIGNGLSAGAWSTRWLHDGVRIDELVDDIPEERRHDRVRDLIDDEGLWSEEKIAWLPAPIRENIKAVLPPAADMGSDRRLWPLAG